MHGYWIKQPLKSLQTKKNGLSGDIALLDSFMFEKHFRKDRKNVC